MSSHEAFKPTKSWPLQEIYKQKLTSMRKSARLSTNHPTESSIKVY
jgi:hypothetical protein